LSTSPSTIVPQIDNQSALRDWGGDVTLGTDTGFVEIVAHHFEESRKARFDSATFEKMKPFITCFGEGCKGK
jgi:hypothetical protein